MIKTPLDPITEALKKQNVVVGRARNAFLAMEAERKNFESKLTRAAEGKSQTEKLMNAQATDEFLAFHKKLNRLQAIWEFEKFKLEILDKEFQAQYLELKETERTIRKHTA